MKKAYILSILLTFILVSCLDSTISSMKTDLDISNNRISGIISENLSLNIFINNTKESYSEVETSAIEFMSFANKLQELLIKDVKCIDTYDSEQKVNRLYADGSRLDIISSYMYFDTSNYEKIQLLLQTEPITNSHDFAYTRFEGTGDLAFSSKAEIFAFLQESFRPFGIEFNQNIQIVSLHHVIMQEFEKEIYEKNPPRDKQDQIIPPKESWTEDDDCYYVILHPSYDGIAFSNKQLGHIESGLVTNPTEMTVLISKRGFESVHIYNARKVETALNTKSIIGIEKALEILLADLDLILYEYESIINQAELCYIPLTDGDTYTPCWLFTLQSFIDKKIVDQKLYCINAITGKSVSQFWG